METELDVITGGIISEAVRLHQNLGPGLLESVYQKLLTRRLQRAGFRVERHKRVAFEYDQIRFEPGLRIDLLVNDLVIVEVKSVKELKPVYAKQVLTYLRLLDLRVGLVMNFGGATLKEGLRRVVNNYTAPAPRPFPRVTA